ncbi:uncharacterized protein LOC135492502 isoform X2 [Lineus longissimus]|uniref:uncharacterized protein LOC135492502 isoform X2 n=1 Tax=Lineus longissimus TaxID=88925 RepID=UPI00315DBE14
MQYRTSPCWFSTVGQCAKGGEGNGRFSCCKQSRKMAQSVCQKTCIVIAAIFGILAGLAVLIIGVAARYAFKAAVLGKAIYHDAETLFSLTMSEAERTSMFERREHVATAFKTTEIVVTSLIALGCVIMLTNFIGCYGALCSSLCMTYIYFVCQILLMCLVSWLKDDVYCELCGAVVKLYDFASPVAGVFIFAALCQALTIYCAWIVAQKIKDGSLKRKGRGMVMFQPQAATTTVVVTR